MASEPKLLRHAPVVQAIDYMLKRWNSFMRFLEDGRICLTNNAAERALRGRAANTPQTSLRELLPWNWHVTAA